MCSSDLERAAKLDHERIKEEAEALVEEVKPQRSEKKALEHSAPDSSSSDGKFDHAFIDGAPPQYAGISSPEIQSTMYVETLVPLSRHPEGNTCSQNLVTQPLKASDDQSTQAAPSAIHKKRQMGLTPHRSNLPTDSNQLPRTRRHSSRTVDETISLPDFSTIFEEKPVPSTSLLREGQPDEGRTARAGRSKILNQQLFIRHDLVRSVQCFYFRRYFG